MKKVILVLVLLVVGILCASQLIPSKLNEKPKTHVLLGNGGAFDKDVYLIITKDSAILRDLIVDILEDTSISIPINVAGMTYFSENQPIVVWIPEIPVTPEDYACVNHELMHVVQFILQWAGVPLEQATTEVYAYEMGYLTKQFYEGIEKIRK